MTKDIMSGSMGAFQYRAYRYEGKDWLWLDTNRSECQGEVQTDTHIALTGDKLRRFLRDMAALEKTLALPEVHDYIETRRL